jgi:hypothetical protein
MPNHPLDDFSGSSRHGRQIKPMFSRVSKQALPTMGIALLIMASSGLRAENSPPVLPDFMQMNWLAATTPVMAKAAVATQCPQSELVFKKRTP